MAIANGYVYIYMPSHHKADISGNIYEHIIVAEQKLGRPLTDEETVHHKDRNRSNNSPDNLIVFATKADHSRYHLGGTLELVGDHYISKPTEEMAKKVLKRGITVSQYKKDYSEFLYLLNKCKICGNECVDIYCSQKCSHIAQQKNNITKEELEKLIHTHSFVDIGRIFGVSDTAIRKWCKKYNLPYRKQDIK